MTPPRRTRKKAVVKAWGIKWDGLVRLVRFLKIEADDKADIYKGKVVRVEIREV